MAKKQKQAKSTTNLLNIAMVKQNNTKTNMGLGWQKQEKINKFAQYLCCDWLQRNGYKLFGTRLHVMVGKRKNKQKIL